LFVLLAENEEDLQSKFRFQCYVHESLLALVYITLLEGINFYTDYFLI
jgi:hypothetical protein